MHLKFFAQLLFSFHIPFLLFLHRNKNLGRIFPEKSFFLKPNDFFSEQDDSEIVSEKPSSGSSGKKISEPPKVSLGLGFGIRCYREAFEARFRALLSDSLGLVVVVVGNGGSVGSGGSRRKS